MSNTMRNWSEIRDAYLLIKQKEEKGIPLSIEERQARERYVILHAERMSSLVSVGYDFTLKTENRAMFFIRFHNYLKYNNYLPLPFKKCKFIFKNAVNTNYIYRFLSNCCKDGWMRRIKSGADGRAVLYASALTEDELTMVKRAIYSKFENLKGCMIDANSK